MLLLRSHFATNYVETSSTLGNARTMAADSDNDNITSYPLTDEYLEYMTIIEGDTKEDAIRLQQLQDLDDDIQSVVDKEHYDEQRRLEVEGREHNDMDEEYRIPEQVRVAQNDEMNEFENDTKDQKRHYG
eukprot:1483078-Amphidinium_carterae.1